MASKAWNYKLKTTWLSRDEAEAKLREINQASNFTKPKMKIVRNPITGMGELVPCEVVEVKIPDESFEDFKKNEYIEEVKEAYLANELDRE